MSKTLTAAAAALAMAGALASSTTSAEARFGRNGAFAAGIIGGLVLGGVAAHGYSHNYYGGCRIVTKRVWDAYYGWTFRDVRVCY